MTNSMVKFLTADTIANDIRMRRNYFSDISFLVVEGPVADARVYNNLVDGNKCQVVPAYSKDKAIEIINKLEREHFGGVLAIVDADFDRLKGIFPSSQNIFLTDSHDLETMILQSPALEKFVCEFGSEHKVQNLKKDIREILLDAGKHIGYLRWASIENKLSLGFEEIKFKNFCDIDGLGVDVLKLIRTVVSNSKSVLHTDANIKLMMEALLDESHDLWQICCGHDLVCILSLGLRKKFGTNNGQEVEPERIEKILRLAYEFSFFSQTQLYEFIQKWELLNHSFQVFK